MKQSLSRLLLEDVKRFSSELLTSQDKTITRFIKHVVDDQLSGYSYLYAFYSSIISSVYMMLLNYAVSKIASLKRKSKFTHDELINAITNVLENNLLYYILNHIFISDIKSVIIPPKRNDIDLTNACLDIISKVLANGIYVIQPHTSDHRSMIDVFFHKEPLFVPGYFHARFGHDSVSPSCMYGAIAFPANNYQRISVRNDYISLSDQSALYLIIKHHADYQPTTWERIYIPYYSGSSTPHFYLSSIGLSLLVSNIKIEIDRDSQQILIGESIVKPIKDAFHDYFTYLLYSNNFSLHLKDILSRFKSAFNKMVHFPHDVFKLSFLSNINTFSYPRLLNMFLMSNELFYEVFGYYEIRNSSHGFGDSYYKYGEYSKWSDWENALTVSFLVDGSWSDFLPFHVFMNAFISGLEEFADVMVHHADLLLKDKEFFMNVLGHFVLPFNRDIEDKFSKIEESVESFKRLMEFIYV